MSNYFYYNLLLLKVSIAESLRNVLLINIILWLEYLGNIHIFWMFLYACVLNYNNIANYYLRIYWPADFVILDVYLLSKFITKVDS